MSNLVVGENSNGAHSAVVVKWDGWKQEKIDRKHLLVWLECFSRMRRKWREMSRQWWYADCTRWQWNGVVVVVDEWIGSRKGICNPSLAGWKKLPYYQRYLEQMRTTRGFSAASSLLGNCPFFSSSSLTSRIQHFHRYNKFASARCAVKSLRLMWKRKWTNKGGVTSK